MFAVLIAARARVCVCAGFGNLEVRRSDFSTLEPGQWLNDEIVNYYVALLQSRSLKAAPKGCAPTTHFFNTFFFATLFGNNVRRRGVAERERERGRGRERERGRGRERERERDRDSSMF